MAKIVHILIPLPKTLRTALKKRAAAEGTNTRAMVLEALTALAHTEKTTADFCRGGNE